ncbi:MAG TPA: DUF6268 family outer membrane beta-barrel protein [Candidatus Udaeobacter sp.]|nr:DUF6268 family outer membrane beta-barrel protein [Candidatus Udaeobacter sp.]
MKRFDCRILAVVCAALSVFFATRIFAQENTDNWFESLSHVPFEYTAEDAYVGGGDVQRGPNKDVRDFDENDSIVHLVFTPRTKLGVLRLGAEWERFSFGLPDHAPLPDTLQSVSLVMGLDMQFSDSIIVRAEGQPGVYDSEFDNLGWDNFNFPFFIGGTYIYSPNLQLVLGVSVDVERKYPVIPAAGLRWKIAPQWLLDAVLPTPRLEFEMNKHVSLYAGATLKQTSYRVDDDFGNSNGIPRLNHAILTYSEVRTGGGFDWKISPMVTFTGEVGYQPYRNFDFYRTEVRYHQDGGAPYGMISLHGAF